MAERHFLNTMPDFVPENSPLDKGKGKASIKGKENTSISRECDESLKQLLSLPYSILTERFKRAALDIKETVVQQTWRLPQQHVQDFNLYRGTLGTAFLLLKSYEITNNKNDLNLCCEIVKACDAAASNSNSSNVTLLLGPAGVFVVGAYAAKQAGDVQLLSYYVTKFKEMEVPDDMPDELLFGKAGYLCACLFINKYIGDETISSSKISSIAKEIIKNGRKLGVSDRCPLMFYWYGKNFWGSAHGLAGIMRVLMEVKLTPEDLEDVRKTLMYMIQKRFPSGNYPSSEEEDTQDILVHWCHGATGMVITLAKAAEVFGNQEFLEAAVDAAEVVWNRGLLKRVGVCHGISGNAYAFLTLYRLTGNMKFLYRAKAFTCFLLDKAQTLIRERLMDGGDSPYSMFEGVAGMAYLLLDMSEPSETRFPAYEP